jgi:Tfp pilus assembly protein PilX
VSRFREERGIAMMLSVFMSLLLLAIAVSLIDTMRTESDQSAHAATRQASYEAAEAGINDYIAKLIDDSAYYLHYVHPGEATRTDTASGTQVSAGNAWTGGTVWSYASKDTWRALGNGYEYDLQITAPTSTSKVVDIVSTGRPTGSTNTGDWRVLEAQIRPSNVADFQMIADADISYGSSATTNGEIYAGIDSNGVAHSVTHNGTATANIYAEGSIYGNPTLQNGAQKYDSTTIRSQIKNAISFSSFLTAFSDIQSAAQYAGIYLNDSTANAWSLKFLSSGQVQVKKCTKSGGQDVAYAAPTCGSATVYSIPTNGAIYSSQDVIVDGTVNGRVTVASNSRIVVDDNISYAGSDDVLGLASVGDMVVAHYCPTNLSWRAATLTENGSWHSYNSDGSKGTMTFTGSTATANGGYMDMFQTRVYNYDTNLQYLPPPWFPQVSDAYSVLFFRECAPSTSSGCQPF